MAIALAASSSHRRTPVKPSIRSLSSELVLTPDGQAALQELLKDLSASLKQGHDEKFGPLPPDPAETREEFMPRCLAHVDELLSTVDRQYTDDQLQTVLLQECERSQQFPQNHPGSFESAEACQLFARRLAAARYQELMDGDRSGYNRFCSDYYDHKTGESSGPTTAPTGPPPRLRVKVDVDAEPSRPTWLMILLASILLALCVSVALVSRTK